jgi:hypothetical protein
MDRRSFIASTGAASLAALAGGAGYALWQEITPEIRAPGRDEGHWLRDRHALPPPDAVVDTGVVILGSGIAGLAAAWQLDRAGRRDFLVIDGPQPLGNAAGGMFGDLAYPTGAHYLPLPGTEATHVRDILHDLGIIQRDPDGETPTYDERVIVHAPEERILFQGVWREGLLPTEGIPAWELAEQRRFIAEVERLRTARGRDGRRPFVFPTVLSSTDPQWAALDRITLRDWLDRQGYRSPTLHWYLNYCCRDDYGTRYDRVSAWAGLHYFCSRWGKAANAANGAMLTWPGGLAPLAEAMATKARAPRRSGTAVSVRQTGDGIEALCFTLENDRPRSFLVRARKAIVAMPVMVAARVVEDFARYGFDTQRDMPPYAPWLVANFLMKRPPRELPGEGLCWDNVVVDEPGLGYVVSTHQDIRVAPPDKTVYSAYVALSHRTPAEARRWMQGASAAELLELASRDLKRAYDWALALCVEKVEITLRGHAMASPAPGFRSNAGLQALRDASGPILFAHSDLSGFSVFEEAAWWGIEAARKAMGDAA